MVTSTDEDGGKSGYSGIYYKGEPSRKFLLFKLTCPMQFFRLRRSLKLSSSSPPPSVSCGFNEMFLELFFQRHVVFHAYCDVEVRKYVFAGVDGRV